MTVRVGLVGAGYIAGWHASALARAGARLVAVCDPAPGAAAALAGAHGAHAHATLTGMLAAGELDAVHVLTPPHLHAAHTLEALAAGLHVLVEKPFAVTGDEARAMVTAAERAGLVLAVNHNFLGLPGYGRLKAAMAAGRLGRIDSADIRWRFPLAPLRSGPFGVWMLRSPENLLLELGPHLYAFATDLFGPLEEIDLRTAKPIALPGGAMLPQVWMIRARAGAVDVTLNLSLVEGVEDRSVEVRGVAGSARLDYGADTLVIDLPNASDIVLNPLRAEVGRAASHLREGLRNAGRQAASLNRRSPYALGFQAAITEFHAAIAAIAAGRAVDARFSGASAVTVIEAIGRTTALLPALLTAPTPVSPPMAIASAAQPDALVIGGTGFVGRALVRALVAQGRAVRVLSRGRANPFADLGAAVEVFPAAMTDPAGLCAAMTGVRVVYHLARAEEATWEAYLANDVAVTEGIADAALEAGVARLVYTGTIASYDASDPSRTITEATPFGPMEDRNLYARSKALCEARLMALHRTRALPLVIARPGIVVGPGGPLQHWGIGRWHGAGAVRIWGAGRNPLPFVLVDDVADALVRIGDVPGIAGQSFNLTGDASLTARGYFDAVHALTGTRIRAVPGNLALFFAGDRVKYLLKRHVLGQKGLRKPLLLDWRSRAHLSAFRNDRAKDALGWRPETDADAFARRAILHPGFFGF